MHLLEAPKGVPFQMAPVEKNSSEILVNFRKLKWNSSKIQGRPLGRCPLELPNLDTQTPTR